MCSLIRRGVSYRAIVRCNDPKVHQSSGYYLGRSWGSRGGIKVVRVAHCRSGEEDSPLCMVVFNILITDVAQSAES